jgi:hypothetical protein
MTAPGFDFEHIAASTSRVMGQAGGVAAQAADQMQSGTFDASAFSNSFGQLMSIASQSLRACLAGGTDVFSQFFESAEIRLPADAAYARELSVVGNLTRVGLPKEIIPGSAISFVPAVLPVGEVKFRVRVNNPLFIGAHYRATVRARRLGIVPADPASQDYVVTVPL